MSTIHFSGIRLVSDASTKEQPSRQGLRKLWPSPRGYRVGEDRFVVSGFHRLWYAQLFKRLQKAREEIKEPFDAYWLAMTQTHFTRSLYQEAKQPVPEALRARLDEVNAGARQNYAWGQTPGEIDLPEIRPEKF